MLTLLFERDFPLSELRVFASSQSAGQRLPFGGSEFVVEDLEGADMTGLDLLLMSAGREVARRVSPRAIALGCAVVDNSSAFRREPDIPLVVPEINGELLASHPPLVANPNCTTIINSMVVSPLVEGFGLRSLSISSYQAASGAGRKAQEELLEGCRTSLDGGQPVARVFSSPLPFNVIPLIGELSADGSTTEELKMRDETRRLLDLPELFVETTCVRVPVLRAHAVATILGCQDDVDLAQATALLRESAGLRLVPIPTPREASGLDEILVGRLRVHPEDRRRLQFFACGDQLRKGAALNAIQIAEQLLR